MLKVGIASKLWLQSKKSAEKNTTTKKLAELQMTMHSLNNRLSASNSLKQKPIPNHVHIIGTKHMNIPPLETVRATVAYTTPFSQAQHVKMDLFHAGSNPIWQWSCEMLKVKLSGSSQKLDSSKSLVCIEIVAATVTCMTRQLHCDRKEEGHVVVKDAIPVLGYFAVGGVFVLFW